MKKPLTAMIVGAFEVISRGTEVTSCRECMTSRMKPIVVLYNSAQGGLRSHNLTPRAEVGLDSSCYQVRIGAVENDGLVRKIFADLCDSRCAS